MSTTALNISRPVALNVLGFLTYGKNGTYPGGFDETLLNAFVKADSRNRERLAIGFPEHDWALNLGIEKLREYIKIVWGEEV